MQNVDFWTSGTQKDCPGKLSWCSIDRKYKNRNSTWTGSDSGECVSIRYGQNNTSAFSKNACDQRFNFICEVRVYALNWVEASKNIFFRQGAQHGNICRRTASRVHGSVEHLCWLKTKNMLTRPFILNSIV